MNLKQTQLHILQRPENLGAKAKTGVSLHCHTENSKEMLDFIPHYAEKLPIISYFWRKESKKYLKNVGKNIDFSTAYWTPPLTANAVYEIEQKQMLDSELNPIVSLTDHDSIDANLRVNESTDAPISLEWTVPYDFGFFHVGVHNLPKKNAGELTETLLDFTFNKENHTNEKLTEMFAMLNGIPEVLVILNHPLWDIEIVGKARHEALLKDFIRTHGRWIHAFEINGFRSWSENKAVIEMAEALGIPIATGGDRHGCRPNTVINLTNADTFDGFVNEIRVKRKSQVVLMPEYEQPLHSRQLQSFAEILKHYPNATGRQKWVERVYFDAGDGLGLRPLTSHGWVRGGPAWLRVAIRALGILGSSSMRPIFRIARDKKDRVPNDLDRTNFEIIARDEITGTLSSGTVS